MFVFRTSVGALFLMSGFLCCGCSSSTSKPAGTSSGVATPAPGTAQAPPAAAPAQPATQPQSPTENSQHAQSTPPPAAKSDVPADSKPNEVKDLIAQIKDIQGKMVQPRTQQQLQALVKDQDKIVELSQKVLAANPEAADRDQVRDAALQSLVLLTKFDAKRRELLKTVDQIAEATLADTAEGPLVASAMFSRAAVHFNIERDGSENDPEINKRLFAMAKEFSEKFATDQRAGMLLYELADNAKDDGQIDTAKEILRYLVDREPQSRVGQAASGKLMLMEAIGKPPAIAGPTLDGSEINITQFKGKVVLVDFWATWCGPCVGELPNVKKVYEKYHEQGFEVVAVSFDQTKDALIQFVEREKLPWPQIFFDEEGKRFWQNPLGQKYGIDSIPATFLVDRQGNLQKIGVRGEALEPAVAELLKGKAPAAN